MVLSRIFGIQAFRLQPIEWDCPEESLGALVGPLHGGRYQCWEVAGKARQIFTKLSTEIKEYLEATTISTCDIISWSMYMVGRTPDKAAPKVLICSTNSKVRKSIRKSIEYSGIMKNYPGVGLGDSSTLPDRHVIRLLSRETIESLIHGNCEPEFAVLVEKERPRSQNLLASDTIAIGRRAFVINPADYSLHPITTGPVIEADGRIYVLTAAHGFVTGSNSGKIEEQVLGELDDCDFDGMSDGEEVIDEPTLELVRSDKSLTFKPFTLVNPFSRSGLSEIRDSLEDAEEPCEIDLSNLEFYGTLALSSATGNRPALDYALIELRNTLGPEELGPYAITIEDADMIGPQDAGIIAYLGESGQVEGELTATPTYIHLPGWRRFQEVYPIRLKSHLFSVGDSGAGVFNMYNERFYGHIVAGGPGTNIAYIVPAVETLVDIQIRIRLGQKPPPITINDLKQIAQEGLSYIFYSMLTGLTTNPGLWLCAILGHYLKVSNGEERSWSESMELYFKFILPAALVMAFGFMVGWFYIFVPRELQRRSRGAAPGKQSGSELLTQQGRSDKKPLKIE
ncbi:Ff.00g085320.m01.CDS01 [Fusarium sp. VM40]|nr:Ff.00g085320.m01.CDS01 [Fusarium sp. VM40]